MLIQDRCKILQNVRHVLFLTGCCDSVGITSWGPEFLVSQQNFHRLPQVKPRRQQRIESSSCDTASTFETCSRFSHGWISHFWKTKKQTCDKRGHWLVGWPRMTRRNDVARRLVFSAQQVTSGSRLGSCHLVCIWKYVVLLPSQRCIENGANLASPLDITSTLSAVSSLALSASKHASGGLPQTHATFYRFYRKQVLSKQHPRHPEITCNLALDCFCSKFIWTWFRLLQPLQYFHIISGCFDCPFFKAQPWSKASMAYCLTQFSQNLC